MIGFVVSFSYKRRKHSISVLKLFYSQEMYHAFECTPRIKGFPRQITFVVKSETSLSVKREIEQSFPRVVRLLKKAIKEQCSSGGIDLRRPK